MANRWQIMKKTLTRGVERTTTNDDILMRQIVRDLQRQKDCLYIVVKDRVKNRRTLIWRRNQQTEIDWWILEDGAAEIEFKNSKTGPDPTDLP